MKMFNPVKFNQSSTQEQSKEDKKENCKYLNSVRSNFTACCEYPLLVALLADYRKCNRICARQNKLTDRCCNLVCLLQRLGIIYSIDSEDGTTRIEIDKASLASSFLLSIENDEKWVPVVNSSIDKCYSQISAIGEFDCGTDIPKHLYLIIKCGYTENYLKCAKWNPFNLKECAFTMQYVQKCFEEKVPDDYGEFTS